MWEFFRFELRYWLRGYMVYIFTALMALMFGLATYSDELQIGGAIGNTFRNAPYVIQQYYAIAGTLGALIITTFFDSAASRDFTSKFSDVLFTKPIRKREYLVGRFLAACVVSMVPIIGISIGIIVAGWLPGRDLERWCPIHWQAHGMSLLTYGLPNTVLVGAIVFAIASWTRSTLYSFLAVLGLLVGYSIAVSIVSELSNETFATLVDPLGTTAFGLATKYWTPDQRNHWVVPLQGWLLVNRVLWMTIALAIFAFAASRFRFDVASRKQSKMRVKDSRRVEKLAEKWNEAWPIVTPKPSWIAQWVSSMKTEAFLVIKSPAFIVVLCFALLNGGLAIFFGANEGFGVSSFPVTYKMIDIVRGTLLFFIIAILTYFAGVLVWKDRDYKIHEIVGATPASNSVFVSSHVVSLLTILFSVLVSMIGLCCLVQLTSGYTRYQLPLYFTELLVIEGLRFGFLVTLAIAAHTLSPNKYVGYFVFVGFLIANAFVWQVLKVDTLLVRFGRLPGYTYSDLFGYAPYTDGLIGFAIYWIFAALIVLWACSAAMHRGVARSFFVRWKKGVMESSGVSRAILVALVVCMTTTGGWLYYNTHVLNKLVGRSEIEKRQADYEKKYARLENVSQPRIVGVKYEIDIFPETRNMVMRGTQTLRNVSGNAIDKLYVNVSPSYDTKLEIPRTKVLENDERLSIRVLSMDPPLEPDESIEMQFEVKSRTRGIENQVSDTSLVQNGTFFNNQIAPHFGYNPERRILDPNRRKKLELPEAQSVPDLTRECGDLCRIHYIGGDADFVDVETIISTSKDQIAVAPGSLLKSWTENDRNYYHYKVDHPSLNFYSFISARYEVDRSKLDDVDVEVYYHKEHPWNVPRMSQAIKDSLSYCSKNYGPYKHKQARIIEFPRVASFAQAFPGTMPYSESIGFIANLTKPDDIDMVYYVVAHEMAHQWWAHQVIGARMQGATLLSETLAQYTALMIMKKEYGSDMMHKFLSYEMNNYLRSRGSERLKERPLLNVDPNQGYIHYQKGSLALYYLADMIGEQRINAVLRELVEMYAYKGPPYPNSHELVDRLRKQTPDDLQYLIKDLFEEITLFDNRTTNAIAKKTSDSKYEVTIEVECNKWKADEKGKETKVEMDDWIEVGAFAKPEKGNRYGKLLHSKRLRLTGGKHTLKFEVDELPHKAGVDPRNMLIDRISDDNLKAVTLEESSQKE